MARRSDSLLLTRGQASRFGRQVLDATLDHIYGGARTTYSGASTAELDRLFDEPLPQTGRDPASVLSECRRKVFRHSMHMSHPRIFGLFNPAPLPVAAFAELAVAFLNQSVDAWKAGPSATHLEVRLIRWMNDLIGFGRDAFGVFTSGGGVANTIALKMARDRVTGIKARTAGLPRDLVGRLRVYASEQAHFSIARSLDLLGLGEQALVRIEADKGMKMRLDHLASAIARDVGRMLVPMAVVATAGTTNTGNIDPLRGVAGIARAHRLHFHVDAAYGGALLFSNRFAARLDGLELADSVTIDPHKWLFQPFSLGGLFVRDGRRLKRSFTIEPGYLKKDLEAESDRLDFYHYSLEGSRPFRGLRFWFSLKALGRQGLGRLVDHTMDVARHLEAEVRRRDWLEPYPAPVECASLCFRYLPRWARRLAPIARATPSRRARLNRVQVLIQQEVERRGFAWFPTIAMDRTVYFRFGIFNYLTRNADVDSVLAHIHRTASSLGL
jgi:glutamate/tyrosine decarboxylase-like PLP-dependent enzyme